MQALKDLPPGINRVNPPLSAKPKQASQGEVF